MITALIAVALVVAELGSVLPPTVYITSNALLVITILVLSFLRLRAARAARSAWATSHTNKETEREMTLSLFSSETPTDLEKLDWKPLLGILRNTLRLRMKITDHNISNELAEAFGKLEYPVEDTPEVKGLLGVLERASTSAPFQYQIDKGPRGMQTGLVGFFQPYKIRLSLEKTQLTMCIAPGEFQWILTKVRKEPGSNSHVVEALKREILFETKTWVRNGNR